jgi:uncharacterized protein (DUF1800 family)
MLLDEALRISLNEPANHRRQPNENLARELLELFALGEGNYSETDVRETARALTGYRLTGEGELTLDPGLIQSVSQAVLPGLRAWVEVGGIAPSQCSKAFLPQPIST